MQKSRLLYKEIIDAVGGLKKHANTVVYGERAGIC